MKQASFVLCVDTQTQFYFWMNLLQGLIPFPEKILGYVKKIAKKGITILVSTYMDEAALCDRIALKKRNRFKD
jgi:hypothetical protein